MTLQDFHTKALHLVKQAEYPEASKKEYYVTLLVEFPVTKSMLRSSRKAMM